MAQVKQSKSERMAEVVAKSMAKEGDVKAPEIRKTGEGEKPKSVKKTSQTVKDWKELNKAKPDWPDDKMKISVLKSADEKPKSGKALDRYKLYKTGMTVLQYVEECKKISVPRGAAIQDIRWDTVKKFIDVK